jgi:hypothetical protein
MSQGKAVHFFATKRDLEILFEAVEGTAPLSYARAGLFTEPTVTTVDSGTKLAELGVSITGSAGKEPTYLVFRNDADIAVRPVPQVTGGTLYAVDQLRNPHTVALKPSGMYGSQALIAGQLSTISSAKESVELYKLFAKNIRSLFRKVRADWLGAEAMALWTRGIRLTASVDASPQLDLKEV